MSIRPSVAHSYKHLIPLQRSLVHDAPRILAVVRKNYMLR
jgi:hypothetical protein